MTESRAQGLAWAVMLAALVIFCAAAAGLPYASYRYVSAATAPAAATVERSEGSVTLHRAGVTVLLEPSGREEASAPEGTEVTTLGDGRAHVRLFDESTINLEPATQLTLVSMRRPQFAKGSSRPNVELRVARQGDGPARLSIGTAWRDTQFRVSMGDAVLTMGSDSRAQITVADVVKVYAVAGSMTVGAAGRTVTLGADRITEIRAGEGPGPPRPALSDVLSDGDFRGTVRKSWLASAEGDPLGTVKQVVRDGRTLLDLRREHSAGKPGDVVLRQDLGPYDLSGASWLGVSTTLKIDDQSLEGGGERATEYPISLRLVVERHDGTEDVPWDVGFYAVDPDDPNPARPGALGRIVAVPVPIGTWVDFRSGNLLDPTESAVLTLADGSEITDSGTRAALDAVERFQLVPLRLMRFEVKGSGHDWHAWLDRLGLWSK